MMGTSRPLAALTRPFEGTGCELLGDDDPGQDVPASSYAVLPLDCNLAS